jgi:hypothetical protein
MQQNFIFFAFGAMVGLKIANLEEYFALDCPSTKN